MAAPPTLQETETSTVAAAPGLAGAVQMWHLTSLDAPTVAVAWCLAFAWAGQVKLPPWHVAVLALAAWSFYIADRLLDARKAYEAVPVSSAQYERLRPRHHFHWRHRRIFVPAAVLAATAGVAITFRSMLPAAAVRNGLLAAAAMAYFTGVHSPWRMPMRKLRLPKELLVGMLFTLACAVPAWARRGARGESLTVPIAIYIALAWLNCHAIECWESRAGQRLRRFRLPVTRSAWGLAAVALLFSGLEIAMHQGRLAWLLAAAALSSALLAMLDRRGSELNPTTLRAAADLALLAPLALLLIP